MKFIQSLLVISLLVLGAFSVIYAGEISRSVARATPLHPNINPILGFHLLYDQCSDSTEYGAYVVSSQNFETILDAFDDELADDFVVPAGEIWTINQIMILGEYYSCSSCGPAKSVDVTVYYDSGTLPGATAVYGPIEVVPTRDESGSFFLDLGTAPVLGAGTYWLSVVANMDFGPFGQWGWGQNIVLRNSGSAWRNPGGGFGICRDWTRTSTCIPEQPDPDLLFCLYGSSATGIPCTDITRMDSRCFGSGERKTIRVQVSLLNNFIHAGEPVTITIDGTPFTSTIITNGTHSRANFSVPGWSVGDHAVSLVDPPGCLADKHANCVAGDGIAKADPYWDDDAEWLGNTQEVPQATALLGNYPNPFNPSTTFRYALSEPGQVALSVYDMLGQLVKTIVNDYQRVGYHEAVWDGKSESGAGVASGVYVYKITAGSFTATKSMLLLK